MAWTVEIGADEVPFIRLGEYALRLDLEKLDDFFLERSRLELRETPEVVEDALTRLKSLIEDEKDLVMPLDDESLLFKFLRPCKFYPDSTFRLMKRYYKFKLKHPELSVNLMPLYVKHVYEDGIINFLPVRSNSGSRIMIISIGSKWNTKAVSVNDLFRSIMLALEIAMIEPKTQVAGVHVIIDLKGLTLHHIWQFSTGFAKTALEFVQECTATRLKGIHVVNQPYIFKMLYAIFKPFIGDKLRKRLYFHGYDRKSFHSKIASESLPPWYDGTLDIPDYPGYLLAEMLCMYYKEFELTNSIGYIKEKASDGEESIPSK